MARFIFVTGGVVSSLGKGLSSASLAYLLQSRGFNVRLRKLDPCLNVDPGTMSPFQHGEVFVTDDGAETDLDLGHYERFSGIEGVSLDFSSTLSSTEDVGDNSPLEIIVKAKLHIINNVATIAVALLIKLPADLESIKLS